MKLVEIGIKSIFISGNKIILPNLPARLINSIKGYDKIFTLNYVEDWDNDNKCVYLHGKLDLNMNIGSQVGKIIMTPENMDKDKSTLLFSNMDPFFEVGLMKPEYLDPYKCLECEDKLSIFGVSPYGDDALFNKIKKMSVVKIYVHNLLNSKEKSVWKEKIPHAELIDSTKFW